MRDPAKTHYCRKCRRWFHPLGIMRHRAMHRDRKETIVVDEPSGTFQYNYAGKS